MVEVCKICDTPLKQRFFPMTEWNIDGPICGRCYSEKIAEFYPGEHVRVNRNNS